MGEIANMIGRMEWMGRILWGGYLGWMSLRDARTKAIPLWMLFIGGVPVLLTLVQNGFNPDILPAMIPGVLLLLLSVLTDAMGRADGIVLLMCGCVCTGGTIWLLLCLSLVYIFLYSMILYILKKDLKKRIPYIPFLFVAYITTWIL